MIQTLFDGFANDHGRSNQRQAHRAAMVIGSQFFRDFASGTPIAFSRIGSRRDKECLMSEQIRLDAGNVLLKPSHRRQLMAWLKRAIRLGAKLGNLVVTLTLQRIGRFYEVRATVHDSAGDFDCRRRNRDWRDAMHDVVLTLTSRLHAQRLGSM